MKTPPQSYSLRRFKNSLFRWLGRHWSSQPAAPESRPRGRSREDQITMDVLRFRLAHLEAMTEKAGVVTYSENFKNFIVQRYLWEEGKLTNWKFARAAEIPVDTLHAWLATAASADALATQPAALAAASTFPARARALLELDWAPETPRFSWAKFVQAVREQFQPISFEGFYFLTDYGRQELHRIYQKNVSRGLAIAAVLHLAGVLVYWSTLEEGEHPQTVTIFKYVEIEPKIVPEIRSARRRAGGGAATEPAAPGAPAPGQPGPINTPENYVPMVAIERLKEIAQLGRPSTPGLAPPQRITSSLQASALPELDIGSIILADKNAPDYQNPTGVGLPTASSSGSATGYTADLAATKVGYGGGGGGTRGGTGTGGGSGGSGGYGEDPGRGGVGSGPGLGNGSGTGLKPAVERKGEAAGTNKVEVKEKNLETVDLNRVFLELIEWLKSNHSELSPVLKHYLRYRPGDLTANVSLTTAPVNYDLYILCNEFSQDIGILMVEEHSGNAIMLRDTGFRKKSFYLSKGRASRDEDRIVSSLTMLENSPTREETSQFYNIFLSWWDNNKKK